MIELEQAEPISESPAEEWYLSFRLEGWDYAVPIAGVREIIRLREITPLPHARSYVRGLISFRGTAVPVIDLRLRLSLPEAAYTDKTCIIILDSDGCEAGFIVDSIQDAVTMESVELPDLLAVLADTPRCKFVRTVGCSNGTVTMVLDTGRVFGAVDEK